MAFKINGKLEERTLLHLVPHGIDSDTFKPLDKTDKLFLEFKAKVLNNREFKYVIIYNSRNINRKRTSNILLAYRTFCDNLPPEKAAECCLILHTELMQDAGTNLLAVKEAFCPDYHVIFSPGKLSPDDMCRLYNVADVLVNASSSEGFGLSCAEGIMCGLPIVVTVTGGLQDQIGQTDENGNPLEFSLNFGSNNDGKYKTHGPWAYPVWPATRCVQGSIPTPYIFDDLGRWEDFADGFMYWYLAGADKRKECGLKGREWALGTGGINNKNMADQLITAMEFVFDNWQPKKRFGIFTVKDHVGHKMPNNSLGFEIPKIDTEKLTAKLETILEK